jgi:hypothetical protein
MPFSCRTGGCRPGRAALAVSVLVLLAGAGPAAGADKYAGEFLRVGAGARALGMGGAFLAVADDATAGYWNPAGLTWLRNKSVLYMHSVEQHSQVQYDFIGLALPQGGEEGHKSSLGVSLVRLGVDDIPVTPSAEELRPGIDYEDGDGNPATNLPTENNGRWDVGERLFLSDFEFKSSNDFAGLFSYAKELSPKFTLGGTVKAVYRTLVGHTAWGAGLDAGMTYQVSNSAALAFVARDLTTTFMSWDTGTSESISPSLSFGGQYTHALSATHILTGAADVRLDLSSERIDSNFGGEGMAGELHVGTEYWYHDALALRAGVAGRDLTFGAGLRRKGLGIDYAAVFNRQFGSEVDFAADENQGVAHRVSGSYDW